MALTYERSGVSIAAADRLIELIRPLAASTARAEVVGSVGGYAGLFALPGYPERLLAATTDGVGTKLKIAALARLHDTVGIDLVAMSVNDLVCVGAEPLLFLDYVATGKLDADVIAQAVSGIAAGCREAGCALIGGETAEHPGFHGPGTYDLAGFAVGLVRRADVIDGTRAAAGDVVVGVPSSGLHSNGFSLVRRILPEEELAVRAVELLTPTRLYVKQVLRAHAGVAGGLRAAAHVTGGGLWGRAGRQMADGLQVRLRGGSWTVPAIFDELRRRGPVEPAEMLRTFNCGLGMVVVVPAGEVDRALAALGTGAVAVGEVVPRPAGGGPVDIEGNVF
jgi:phosphoribosylformylglycinamidine cyclo-ligase